MKYIVTSEREKKYWQEQQIDRENVTDCMHVVNVYPEITGQQIEGFGGAFTEASTYNYSRLDIAMQEQVIAGYFGKDGLRYNLARTHIHSCDFALGNYTYIEEGDEKLETFNIEHDRAHMIPMIKAAMVESDTPIHFLASPWSPPAFMKTNNDMNHGGKLKKEYYQLWAEYVVRYIKAYAKEGIRIDAITVQNEPEAIQTWDSCTYTPEEEAAYAAGFLAPALRRAGLCDVKIFVWDHNKEQVYDRVREIFGNEEARACVDGVTVHWYTGDHFEAIAAVKKMYPEKKVYFTEGCVEYSRFADSGEVQKAEMYAHDMIGNLNAGIEAVFDWNLMLDEKGGPNHVGNFCAAPMMCDHQEKKLEKRLSYYYIGHFSRYIRRGARQILSTRYTDRIETAAFLNPNGERVVILLNRTDEPVEVTLRENGAGTSTVIAAHSIVTFLYEA